MSTIVGIDVASTRLDLVLLDEDTLAARHHEIPCGRNAIETAWRMRDWLPGPSWWEHHGVRLVAMERPVGGKIWIIQAQVMVIGAVLSRLPQSAGMDVILPRPQQWRTAIGLAGNARKENVYAWALEHGADESWTQDAADALALAWGAMQEPGRKRIAA